MTMIVTNINEIKAKLSEYLEAVGRGERVVICKRNTPIAELRAIAPTRMEPRKIGGAVGRLTIPDSFFHALPDNVLADFDGGALTRGVAMVAERRPAGYEIPTQPSGSKGRRNPRSRSRKKS